MGENRFKLRYGQYENDGRKSGVIWIIRYGPYIKSGNDGDKKLGGKVIVVCESGNEKEQ